jgi:hypothetical protein
MYLLEEGQGWTPKKTTAQKKPEILSLYCSITGPKLFSLFDRLRVIPEQGSCVRKETFFKGSIIKRCDSFFRAIHSESCMHALEDKQMNFKKM